MSVVSSSSLSKICIAVVLVAGCKPAAQSSIKNTAGEETCAAETTKVSEAKAALDKATEKQSGPQVSTQQSLENNQAPSAQRNCENKGLAVLVECMRGPCNKYNNSITTIGWLFTKPIACNDPTAVRDAIAERTLIDYNNTCANEKTKATNACNNQPNRASVSPGIPQLKENLTAAGTALQKCLEKVSAKKSASNASQSSKKELPSQDDLTQLPTTETQQTSKVVPANKNTAQPTTSTVTTCPTGQVRDGKGACVSTYSDCKDGYYMANDGRCYLKPTATCKSTEYLAVDGKCYPIGNSAGNKTSCENDEVLTTLKTCVPDANYSKYDGNYR